MQISNLLNDSEIKELQHKFYEYFETGYAFEEFLKEYLLKMGLDEVEITQRSRDGGVDLKAIRKGVGDFSGIDITHYYIQAKRYAFNTKISVNAIRELKGTIPFGYKGMMITTSSFTQDAIAESTNDQSKPVVIINGMTLVTSCIDNEIGFIYKPKFSSAQMDKFLNKKADAAKETVKNEHSFDEINYIEKTLTFNDIRSRIISIPSSVMKNFTEEMLSVKVIVNESENYNFNIVRGRNYLAGVTQMLKKFEMISDDGVITPKLAKWYYDSSEKIVYLKL